MTYISETEFEEKGHSLRFCFERLITSDMTDLTNLLSDDTMAEEYVHSAAGKED